VEHSGHSSYRALTFIDSFAIRWQFLSIFIVLVLVFGFHTAGIIFLSAFQLSLQTIFAVQLLILVVSYFSPSLKIVKSGLDGVWKMLRESYLIPIALLGAIAFLVPAQKALSPSLPDSVPPDFEKILGWQFTFLLNLISDFQVHPDQHFASMIGAYTFLDFIRRTTGHFVLEKNLLQSPRKFPKWMTANLWATFAVIVPFRQQYFFPICMTAFLVQMLVVYLMIRRSARQTYFRSPVAYSCIVSPRTDNPWAVHISDIHLTGTNNICAEGGKGGNDNLEEFARTMRYIRPSFAFITGDLTDQGSPQEWQEAKTILEPVQQNGCRVIIAPGNHDLMTAYSPGAQYVSAVSGPPWVANAFKMRRYLVEFCSINPDMLVADGRLLADVLKKDQAITDYMRRLAELESVDPVQVPSNGEILEQLRAWFPGADRDVRTSFRGFFIDSLAYMDTVDMFRGYIYHDAWYDFFPLHLVDHATQTHIFVLNSVARDLSLMGSAGGDFGDGQLDRFETLATSSNAVDIVVLLHHASFRWSDEFRPNLSPEILIRWASLSTSNTSASRLTNVMLTARKLGKRLFLFCGHRHGGSLRESRIGGWQGCRIAEGAAMVESSDAIIAASRVSNGIRLGILKS
jgi:hypothetical protein